MEKHGIQETKEAMIAAFALGLFMIERFKDGVGIDDGMAAGQKLMDPKFRELILAGIRDADKIKTEIEDISFPEGAELMKALIDMLAVSKAA